FFCSSRRRHTRFSRDWSSDVCSSDLERIDERRKTCRPVLAVAAEEPHAAPFDAGDQPITVELDLVQPPVAGRGRPGAGRELRIEIGRASCRERGERWGAWVAKV